LTELIQFDIYEHPVVNDENWNDLFKYCPIDFPAKDPENLTDWRRPQTGRLRSFRLYQLPRFDNIDYFAVESAQRTKMNFLASHLVIFLVLTYVFIKKIIFCCNYRNYPIATS